MCTNCIQPLILGFKDVQHNYAVYNSDFRGIQARNSWFHFLHHTYSPARNYFIPFSDICVFIGSRSHYGQSHWTWNNGTMVADTSNFPSPDSSVCEQMTWPLTYDDGINLRAKDCSKEAHYVCRVDGNISLLLF